MGEVVIPSWEDHSSFLVLVHLHRPPQLDLQPASPPSPPSPQATPPPFAFNRVVERLRRLEALSVDGDGGPRVLRPRFITAYDRHGAAWGDFQAHRRVLGLLYVDCSGDGEITSLQKSYGEAKDSWKQWLFDSRCLCFGAADASDLNDSEYIQYSGGEDSGAGLETDVREFLRSIYWILESKRVDRSWEQMETPPCPSIRDEEKYRLGLEHKNSKNYRKKCLGRLRKQVGDFHLLAGLAGPALEAYTSAIDALRAANDWLWLAGAYEGWAVAAMAARYGSAAVRKPSLARVATFSGTSLAHPLPANNALTRSASGDRGSLVPPSTTPNGSPARPRGHSRNASSGAALAPSASVPSGLVSPNNDQASRNSNSLPHSASANKTNTPTPTTLVAPPDILERFRLAVDNYEKFSFAASLECECIIKASAIYRYQREFCEMESFLREKTGKFLEGTFTSFSHIYKAWLCCVLAGIFSGVGFERKAAFFLRLSALFRLHPPGKDPAPPSLADYRQVYPVLQRALGGCGVGEKASDIPLGCAKGWTNIQVRSLHEVYVVAKRANYPDAAIRHLAFLLQGYLEDLEPKFAENVCGDLLRLCGEEGRQLPFPLQQHLDLPAVNLLLRPIALTKIPKLLSFTLIPLPGHLAPAKVPFLRLCGEEGRQLPFPLQQHLDLPAVNLLLRPIALTKIPKLLSFTLIPLPGHLAPAKVPFLRLCGEEGRQLPFPLQQHLDLPAVNLLLRPIALTKIPKLLSFTLIPLPGHLAPAKVPFLRLCGEEGRQLPFPLQQHLDLPAVNLLLRPIALTKIPKLLSFTLIPLPGHLAPAKVPFLRLCGEEGRQLPFPLQQHLDLPAVNLLLRPIALTKIPKLLSFTLIPLPGHLAPAKVPFLRLCGEEGRQLPFPLQQHLDLPAVNLLLRPIALTKIPKLLSFTLIPLPGHLAPAKVPFLRLCGEEGRQLPFPLQQHLDLPAVNLLLRPIALTKIPKLLSFTLIPLPGHLAPAKVPFLRLCGEEGRQLPFPLQQHLDLPAVNLLLRPIALTKIPKLLSFTLIPLPGHLAPAKVPFLRLCGEEGRQLPFPLQQHLDLPAVNLLLRPIALTKIPKLLSFTLIPLPGHLAPAKVPFLRLCGEEGRQLPFPLQQHLDLPAVNLLLRPIALTKIPKLLSFTLIPLPGHLAPAKVPFLRLCGEEGRQLPFPLQQHLDLPAVNLLLRPIALTKIPKLLSFTLIPLPGHLAPAKVPFLRLCGEEGRQLPFPLQQHLDLPAVNLLLRPIALTKIPKLLSFTLIPLPGHLAPAKVPFLRLCGEEGRQLPFPLQQHLDLPAVNLLLRPIALTKIPKLLSFTLIPLPGHLAPAKVPFLRLCGEEGRQLPFPLQQHLDLPAVNLLLRPIALTKIPKLLSFTLIPLPGHLAPAKVPFLRLCGEEGRQLPFPLQQHLDLPAVNLLLRPIALTKIPKLLSFTLIPLPGHLAPAKVPFLRLCGEEGRQLPFPLQQHLDLPAVNLLLRPIALTKIPKLLSFTLIPLPGHLAPAKVPFLRLCGEEGRQLPFPLQQHLDLPAVNLLLRPIALTKIPKLLSFTLIPLPGHLAPAKVPFLRLCGEEGRQLPFPLQQHLDLPAVNLLLRPIALTKIPKLLSFTLIPLPGHLAPAKVPFLRLCGEEGRQLPFPLQQHLDLPAVNLLLRPIALTKIPKLLSFTLIPLPGHLAPAKVPFLRLCGEEGRQLPFPLQQHLDLPAVNLLLRPIALTKIPKLLSFTLIPLPGHLAPAKVPFLRLCGEEGRQLPFPLQQHLDLPAVNLLLRPIALTKIPKLLSFTLIPLPGHLAPAKVPFLRLCGEEGRQLPFPLQQHLDLPAVNLLLRPIALTKIPKLLSFTLIPLPGHLAPAKVPFLRLCGEEGRQLPFPLQQHLDLPAVNLLLRPIALTKIPKLLSFTLIPLPGHLAPAKVQSPGKASVFIYNPYAREQRKATYWVVGCSSGVSVSMANLLPFELEVANLSIITKGADFEAEAISVTLPPAPGPPIQLQLLGTPIAAGDLTLTGYSCEVLGVRNVCALTDVAWPLQSTGRRRQERPAAPLSVEVLPSLPRLGLSCSVDGKDCFEAPSAEEEEVTVATAQLTLYSGQTHEHWVRVKNQGLGQRVRRIGVVLEQPAVCGGSPLLVIQSEAEERLADGLDPKADLTLPFKVFGIDPLSVIEPAEEESGACAIRTEQGLSTVPVNLQGDLIPYSGRLMTTSFTFTYEGGEDGAIYARQARLMLYILVVPAVLISDWRVLAGEGADSRYLALDISNATDAEADLDYGPGKAFSVQAKDVCRVPISVPCSEGWVDTRLGEKGRLVVEVEEAQRQKRRVQDHIAAHLAIHWTIPSLELSGGVPIGTLLASDDFLRQIVLPPLLIDVWVDGQASQGGEERTVGVGEKVAVELRLAASAGQTAEREWRGQGALSVFQDLQLSPNSVYSTADNQESTLDRNDHVLFVGPINQLFFVHGHDVPASLKFSFILCHEGVYKVRPCLNFLKTSSIRDGGGDEVFLPLLSFNAITRIG